MKIKTSELDGIALDWAVAKAAFPLSYRSGDRLRVRAVIDGEECTIGAVFLGKPANFTTAYSPSENWAQGGPLIGARAALFTLRSGLLVASVIGGEGEGPTHLVAAMRAIVASELGDEVDVPDELAEVA